jgi:prevent-host-death family protein
MKSVGIRELKAKLSSYIDEVRSGQGVIVTDHGQDVALLSPLSDERRLVSLLEKSGRIQWSKGKPTGLDRGVQVKGAPMSLTILEERG